MIVDDHILFEGLLQAALLKCLTIAGAAVFGFSLVASLAERAGCCSWAMVVVGVLAAPLPVLFYKGLHKS